MEMENPLPGFPSGPPCLIAKEQPSMVWNVKTPYIFTHTHTCIYTHHISITPINFEGGWPGSILAIHQLINPIPLMLNTPTIVTIYQLQSHIFINSWFILIIYHCRHKIPSLRIPWRSLRTSRSFRRATVPWRSSGSAPRALSASCSRCPRPAATTLGAVVSRGFPCAGNYHQKLKDVPK